MKEDNIKLKMMSLLKEVLESDYELHAEDYYDENGKKDTTYNAKINRPLIKALEIKYSIILNSILSTGRVHITDDGMLNYNTLIPKIREAMFSSVGSALSGTTIIDITTEVKKSMLKIIKKVDKLTYYRICTIIDGINYGLETINELINSVSIKNAKILNQLLKDLEKAKIIKVPKTPNFQLKDIIFNHAYVSNDEIGITYEQFLAFGDELIPEELLLKYKELQKSTFIEDVKDSMIFKNDDYSIYLGLIEADAIYVVVDSRNFKLIKMGHKANVKTLQYNKNIPHIAFTVIINDNEKRKAVYSTLKNAEKVTDIEIFSNLNIRKIWAERPVE